MTPFEAIGRKLFLLELAMLAFLLALLVVLVLLAGWQALLGAVVAFLLGMAFATIYLTRVHLAERPRTTTRYGWPE